ncbi:MAG: SMC-Scp complex subunit ScpB [Lachnospiraceae bacterium]|nr:SMC-Scp complex subunit ScpB [Lachnospiraceae bacterium]
MNRTEAKAAIEAILFTIGDSVEIARLAEAVELDKKEVTSLLKELQSDYQERSSGLQLVFLEDAVQMGTRPEYYDTIIRIARTPRKVTLSETVLETMSIVAYKQPVTRMEIEKIRGVSCDHAINKLLEYDLIQELGRLDAPGRPILFGTTEQFLRSFGLSSLEDMPEASALQIEEFKQEAEEEVPLKLDI